MSRMRGGRKHKNKKSKAEKKQVTGEESVSDKGLAILESVKAKVIQQIEESDEYRRVVACVSEGNDIEADQKVQGFLSAVQELSRLDKGQKGMMECGIRRAETRAQSTDEPEVTSGFAEMRSGRGSAGLVRVGDEKRHRKRE